MSPGLPTPPPVPTLEETSLSAAELRMLDRMVRALDRRYRDDLRAVWPFGSRARGEPGRGIDSDATNFLVCEARMQRLVPRPPGADHRPARPVRALHDDHGISTVLATSGSGDYFDVADHVIQLLDYQPREVAARDRRRAPSAERPSRRGAPPARPGRRAHADRGRTHPVDEHGHHVIRALTPRPFAFGPAQIGLDDVEQLLERPQAQANALALERLAHELDGRRTLRAALDAVAADVARDGLDALEPLGGGGLSGFRVLELAAAVNRIRELTKSTPSVAAMP